jgi:hypothetical protein
MKSKFKVVFEYNTLEVEWYGNHTFNVYAIDECGVRDEAIDCFTNYAVQTLQQAQIASDWYIKDTYSEVA